MIFRDASKDDVKRCLELARQEDEKYWTESDFIGCIENTDSIFLVVEVDGVIAGYTIGYIVPTKFDEAMVHETRIDPEFRGQKLGTKIVDEFCKKAFEKCAKTVYAMIEEKIKPFYIESCGFKETGHWVEASLKAE